MLIATTSLLWSDVQSKESIVVVCQVVNTIPAVALTGHFTPLLTPCKPLYLQCMYYTHLPTLCVKKNHKHTVLQFLYSKRVISVHVHVHGVLEGSA